MSSQTSRSQRAAVYFSRIDKTIGTNVILLELAARSKDMKEGPRTGRENGGAAPTQTKWQRLLRPLDARSRWSASGTARRHQAVESEVDDQVAIVIHVVLDGEQDGRPPLDLLAAPTFHHL